MAEKEEKKQEKKKQEKKEPVVKVKALVNMKYDAQIKKAGEELEIRETDVAALVERNIVEEVE